MGFRGFPSEAFDFYARLEVDNSKSFWDANRSTYETAIKAPFAELGDALAGDYGRLRLFRPNRDVRFSKDKSPYKTAAGAVTEGEGGAHYYVQVSATGLFAAAGYYELAADQLARYREALDHARHGPALEKAVATVRAAGLEVGGEELKTAPRGYAKDHPRIALLRHKRLYAGKSFPIAGWVHTAKSLERIRGVFDATRPITTWLDKHVGPSTLPPDERELFR